MPERVWQELSRGLMEARPSRMLEVLRDCGALARVLPEVDRLFGVPQRADYHPEVDTGVHLMMVLDMAARLGASLPVRYACLGHDLGKGTTPAEILPRHLRHEERSVELVREMSDRLRVDNACRALAEVVAREHGNIHRSGEFGAAAIVRLLERCDALRRPDRFAELLLACECDARGRLGLRKRRIRSAPRLLDALRPRHAVDATAVAAEAAARGARRAGDRRGDRRRARAGRRGPGAALRKGAPRRARADGGDRRSRNRSARSRRPWRTRAP